MNLNGVEYDACPIYQIGQFTPFPLASGQGRFGVLGLRLAIAGCTLNLQQDWSPAYTKLLFDVWNSDEVKFTGAYDCADSWHETSLGTDVDAGSESFSFANVGTFAARYRVQGVKSTQCPGSEAIGLVAVQSSLHTFGAALDTTGTTLQGAGKYSGRITWDVSGAVPEATIR
jgi:hypothetical protein